MSKIGIDLRQIKERAPKGRNKSKRSPSRPRKRQAKQLPKLEPRTPKGWEYVRGLSSALHCPQCDNEFNAECQVGNQLDAFFRFHPSAYSPNAGTPRMLIFLPEPINAELSRHESLTQKMDDYSRNSEDVRAFIKCNVCGHIAISSRWMLADNKLDDAGAQVEETQERLRERNARIDEIADESETQQNLESEPKPNEKE